ncbi:proteinase inhibitor I4 serpin [Cylindrospermum sp. FACHB-282]|uniref:proteinase inhibitor I4 serpin n=1 Tax=Cylindrospermum sp. FACHB-282 TaxID=2692794 RepID=UPI001687F93F|nr:proteinase inhibitor I4 serpin [Cylindrospermum sp. FACHB-282]MBD2384780.1 proteinase inhibitor I4 serpin [Cylindrospermum sp. FACHB-282]
MNRQKFSGERENFLQRRYGVRLGRRYVLAAASVMLFNVLGYSSMDTSANALAQSPLPSAESPLSKKPVKPDPKNL